MYIIKSMLFFALLSLCNSGNVTTSDWIGDSLLVIGNLTLKNLTLPGSHLSGTYNLTEFPLSTCGAAYAILEALSQAVPSSPGDLAVAWNKAQDQDIYQQLLDGIRYFDIWAAWDTENQIWMTSHLVYGHPIQILLENITHYLTNHTKEIVIVELSHFDNSPSSENITVLNNLVAEILGNFTHPVDLSFKFTVKSMVETGKRAIVTMEQGYDGNATWPATTFKSNYTATSSVGELRNNTNFTVQAYVQNRTLYQNTLAKLYWVLTPNDSTYQESTNSVFPQSLIEFADTVNTVLPTFWETASLANWTLGNVIVVDHYQTSEVVAIAWQMNGIINRAIVKCLLAYAFVVSFI